MTLKRAGPSGRQRALMNNLARAEVAFAIISDPRHVYYLSGFLTYKPKFTSLLLLEPASGNSTLFVGGSEETRAKSAHSTEVITFEDYQLQSRMVAYPNFIAEELGMVVETKLGSGGHASGKLLVGIEEWHLARTYTESLDRSLKRDVTYVGLSDRLAKMRRTKSQEEVSLIEKAVHRLDLAYATARQHTREGSTEMDLYSNINKMIFDKFGAFNFGERPNVIGDFVSGPRTLARGGPPTRRQLKRSDTVILDLATACDHYWGDTARTFVVGGKPSASQLRVHKAIMGAKRAAEGLLRPGTTGAEIYAVVSKSLRDSGYSDLPHHAGHGLGLDDQEAPFFLPNSGDKLVEGTACAVEPGVYTREGGGMRVENDYVITADGFRRLSKYPLGLE